MPKLIPIERSQSFYILFYLLQEENICNIFRGILADAYFNRHSYQETATPHVLHQKSTLSTSNEWIE